MTAAGPVQQPAAVRVSIAVCTYLRPAELADLLPRLVRQAEEVTRSGGYDVRVLVVDNDPAGSADHVVQALADPRVRYEHEPRPGIAAARNRALDACREDSLLAFIDDDERPHDDWLLHLLRTWRTYDATAVSGRVVAEFDGELDPWLEAGTFFVRRNLATGDALELAAAGNLLLDLDRVRDLRTRFDERFGLTGGEDTAFTRDLYAAGARMVWCAESVVTDRVPRSRMTRRWVLERARSHGRATTRVALAMAPNGLQRSRIRVRQGARGVALTALGSARASYGRISGSDRHDALGRKSLARGRGLLAGLAGPGAAAYGRELVVLQSFPEPRPTTNPYVVMLRDHLGAEPDVTVRTFGWRAALLSRYDVFHAHWPEILVGGRTPAGALGRQLLLALLLLRLRATRRPLVRTKHNLDLPSGLGRGQVALLRWAERWTTLYVRLNPTTPVPTGALSATIAHGHYRDWFAGHPRADRVPGRLTYVGQVRGYKGVEALLDAFAGTPGAGLTLHVAGRPTSQELAEEVRSRAGADARVTLTLEHVSDADLVREVSEAELVVLPYRVMHNSGGVLAALSLDRPVLVPDNEVNRALQRECGAGWVHLYSGDLDADALGAALTAVRSATPSGRPALHGREWPDAATDHVRAYRAARARLGRGEAPAATAPSATAPAAPGSTEQPAVVAR
ncbi:glycosyltransferase [Luteipulveratus flavus]|uniref:Glycosyltransferase n=1 Tax=Luteipulveratus flavus TaxID=3031728 RepID=A0ABT6CC33_9MICO|nr:glycosyltransferase [Luteipulveratus sp. YIM 133296]MDF8266475.1 glycosyltransferase [Luteipulveratus sp. YIM 133296]